MFPQIAVDREWSCGVAKSTQSPSDLAAQGFFSDSLLSSVAVETAILDGEVNDPDVKLCIILTRPIAPKQQEPVRRRVPWGAKGKRIQHLQDNL
jgi:hypothetical protein